MGMYNLGFSEECGGIFFSVQLLVNGYSQVGIVEMGFCGWSYVYGFYFQNINYGILIQSFYFEMGIKIINIGIMREYLLYLMGYVLKDQRIFVVKKLERGFFYFLV